ERELPAISYLVRGPSRYPRAESLAVGHLNHSRVEIKSHDMARGSGDNCEVNGRCTWSTSNIEDVRPRLEAKGLDRLQPKLTYGRCRRYLAQIRRRNIGNGAHQSPSANPASPSQRCGTGRVRIRNKVAIQITSLS